jgi:hypothetical protein
MLPFGRERLVMKFRVLWARTPDLSGEYVLGSLGTAAILSKQFEVKEGAGDVVAIEFEGPHLEHCWRIAWSLKRKVQDAGVVASIFADEMSEEEVVLALCGRLERLRKGIRDALIDS